MSDLIDRQAAIDAIESHIRTAEEPYQLSRADEVMNHAFEIAASCVYNLPSAQPEPCKDAVSREAVSEWLKQYGQDVLHGKYKFSLMYIWKNLMALPPAQPEQKWETCFDCPLSHGCPKINGCTNGQIMEYASEIPDDCPISAQPRKGKWIDYSDEGYVECPFCHSATNCDDNKDELHYCFSCGAELN